MKKPLLAIMTLVCITSAVTYLVRADDEAKKEIDKDLAGDLALLQGSWELIHGNEGDGPPTIRSVKVVEGNVETLRRYDINTGELKHEHSVEFKLTKSGNVRVFTFHRVGAPPKFGLSYVYKIDKDDFYDIPGLLHGDQFRNYQPVPTLWHWKRVVKDAAEVDASERAL